MMQRTSVCKLGHLLAGSSPWALVFTRTVRGSHLPRGPVEYTQKERNIADWETIAELKEIEREAVQHIEKPVTRSQSYQQQEERPRKKVLYKIIEHRHFKKEREENFLTWDAKEQIRYLHREYPEEWTIEKIAKSFPISQEGVIKLLRSKFVPDSMERIIQHDKKVREKWLQLKAASDSGGGPIAVRYQQLLDQGKLHTLQNAAGIPALPSPASKQYLPVAPQADTPKPVGAFYAIVKDYCEKKHLQNPINKQNTTQGTIHRDSKKLLASDKQSTSIETFFRDTKKLLAAVTKAVKPLKQKKYLMSAFKYEEGIKDDSKQDFKKLSLIDTDIVTEKSERIKQLKSLASDERHSDTDATSERTSTQLNELQRYPVAEMPRKPQLNDPSIRETLKQKKAIFDKMKYEKQGESKQAYVFDSQHGYQHPLGKQVNTTNKLKPRNLGRSSSNDIQYRKGDTFYDKDGEFLYRVPGLSEQ